MFAGASSGRPERKHEKVLLRVFCHAYGTKIVLLLNGYDKAGDPSEKRQQREIMLARRRLAEFIELREKHHLTQVELAEKTGLPQAQISRIERGAVSPTSATLARIAEALGADLRLVERPQPTARRSAAS